jgi:hypothetical protein
MSEIRIVAASLVVWMMARRVQTMLTPVVAARRMKEGLRRARIAETMICTVCLSFWLSGTAALFLGSSWLERTLLWPLISGISVYLNRYSEPDATAGIGRENAL